MSDNMSTVINEPGEFFRIANDSRPVVTIRLGVMSLARLKDLIDEALSRGESHAWLESNGHSFHCIVECVR